MRMLRIFGAKYSNNVFASVSSYLQAIDPNDVIM